MDNRARLLVALVLKGMVATEVNGLRRSLGSSALGRIPPHVTLVAPVNVATSDLDEIDTHLKAVAGAFEAPEVSLGPVSSFAPVNPVLYLEVHGELDVLQQALCSGPLRAPENRPVRPFVAHVTLSPRADPEVLAAGMLALSSYRQTVLFPELTLFRQDEDAAEKPWREIADFGLLAPARTGRGGREIVFRHARQLSQTEEPFFSHEWHEALLDGLVQHEAEEPIVFVASLFGEPVAVARGVIVGDMLELRELVVGSAHRREGIAVQLLTYLERVGKERSLREITVRPLLKDAGLFLGRGYRQVTARNTERLFVRALAP